MSSARERAASATILLFRYHTGKTFAEMTEKEKNAVSHRAVAAEKMCGVLMEAL